jgi:N-acetylglucosamine-6-phosphate deacetylase
VADLLISAPRVIPAASGTGVLEPGYVAVTAGRISAVAAGPPPGRPDVELATGVLLPGFVDLQVNGYYGVEMSAADPDGWALVRDRLPETGTTAFLPTFITAPVAELAAELRCVASFVPGMPRGAARVLGVHVEGPFISPARRGAHNADWIIPAAPAAVGELLAAGAGVLRLVTLAPEAEGGLAAIERLTGAGVVVSVGHSDATGEQVAQAAAAGARMVTHVFNGQRPLGSYEPGVTGRALTDRRLTSGLIADLHHACGEACIIAFAAAPGRICLVTDASACAGMPAGRYLLGGEPIELPPGEGAPPRRPDGGLAGSALRMDRAVANMVSVGVGLAPAVAAATRVPADLIGRPDLGRLAPGAAADMAWLDDDLRTQGTWIDGERVYP